MFTLPPVKLKLAKPKRSIAMPDFSTLYPQQQDALQQIIGFMDDEATNLLMLDCPAGAGKSFLMSVFMEYFMVTGSGPKLVHTATTNKAVRVCVAMADYAHPSLEYMTVHSLLGLKEQIQMDGTIKFVQDYDRKMNKVDLSTYDLLVIDECSMLDSTLFTGDSQVKGLWEYAEDGLKVIFVGDQVQIPPVGTDDFTLFINRQRRKFRCQYVTMPDTVRQTSDSPILALTTKVRLNISSTAPFKPAENTVKDDMGVYVLDKSDTKGLDDLLRLLFTSQNFAVDSDFAKVIAWRNKTVDGINTRIRGMLYPESLQRIEPGERLIALDPVFDGDDIIASANEECTVISFRESVEDINDGQFVIPYYSTTVESIGIDGLPVRKVFRITTHEGEEVYEKLLGMMKAGAKAQIPGSREASAAWKQYYKFMRKFARVGYNYAITAHRSQGSTYDNAVVLEWDIRANRKERERNRILYTAFSRPRHRLFII
ncbi:MAG: AAA family ATPase [Chitinophagales bacterium]|nr:AAA family ATPase [Chitinophagales bacterium]